ncbi:MAG TPA: hypothetical protein VJI12_03655 [archaeon]|nr:hypothetical protein [archaeon]
MKINIKLVQGKSEMTVEGQNAKEIIDSLDDIQTIIEKISGMSSMGVPVVTTSTSQGSNQFLNVSASELMSQTKPRNISDKIILMVYYLWQTGTQTVHANDMASIFKQVLEPPAKNWGVMLNNLVTKGFLTTAAKKDNIRAWSITRTGMDHVEKNLLKKDAEK